MLKIFRFAKPHWLLILCTLGAMVLYAASEGAFLLLMGPFIDAFRRRAEGGAELDLNPEKLYRVGKFILLLAPLIAAGAFSQRFLRGRVIWLLTVDLRNAICSALMPQSLTFFEDRRSGDLMSRITNDVTRSEVAFGQMFGTIPEHGLHMAMGASVAAIASWKLFLAGLVSVPLVLVPIVYLARKIRKYSREGLEKLSDLTDQMAQMFSGIRVIKAFKMEQAEIQEFQRVNSKLFSKMMKQVRTKGLSAGALELVTRSLIGAGLLIAIWAMTTGYIEIALSNLILCIGGTYYSFNALRRLVKAYNQLQGTIPAADRIMELIEERPALEDAPDAAPLERVQRGIRFDNVSFAYGSEPVLRNVSFEARAGETVAVVGRSGAGKSTLIALIPRFYDVTAGSIEIDGLDVRKIKRDSLLDRVAIVSQQTFLFNRSIAENLRYGRPGATMEEVEQAAHAANIHDFIVSLPDGYESLCGEFGTKLSGGQRQRIAIARALLKNADILILDEAMAGLDAESEAVVRQALQDLMRGRTTFVITHDLYTIQHADRILVLTEGRLVAQGTHEQLMAQGGEYSSLYALQFKTVAIPVPATRRPSSEY